MLVKPFKPRLSYLDFGLSKTVNSEVNKSKRKIMQEKASKQISPTYELLIKKYHNKNVNIKGKLSLIQFEEIEVNPLRYHCKIAIEEDSKIISMITIRKIKQEMLDKLRLIREGTYLYLTNLSSIISLSENSYDIKNNYTVTIYTQLFYKEAKPYTPKILKYKSMHSDQIIMTSSKKGKRKEIIETLSPKQLCSILDAKQIEYKELLSCKVEHNVFRIGTNFIKKVFDNDNDSLIKSIIGRILSISLFENKKGKNQQCIKIASLIDHNIIDLYIGSDILIKDFENNILVQFNNIYRKVNDKLKIFLHTDKRTTYKILSHGSLIELPSIKYTYPYSLTQLTPLIDLQKNQLIRYNIAFLGKITHIYSIRAQYNRQALKITYLIKALIDDGTSISMGHLRLSTLSPIITLPKSRLDKLIEETYKKADDYLIYDKSNQGNFLHYNEITSVQYEEFYFIGVPFCNMSICQRLNKVDKFMTPKWTSRNFQYDEKIEKYCFINGKISYNYQFKEKEISLQSALDIFHVEKISENDY